MTSEQLAGYALIAGFVALWFVALVAWIFAAFYMIKVLNRFHPERTWGKFIPISLFVPWFFTEEGNKYRVKLLQAAGIFILSIGIGLGFGALTGMLTTQGAP